MSDPEGEALQRMYERALNKPGLLSQIKATEPSEPFTMKDAEEFMKIMEKSGTKVIPESELPTGKWHFIADKDK